MATPLALHSFSICCLIQSKVYTPTHTTHRVRGVRPRPSQREGTKGPTSLSPNSMLMEGSHPIFSRISVLSELRPRTPAAAQDPSDMTRDETDRP